MNLEDSSRKKLDGLQLISSPHQLVNGKMEYHNCFEPDVNPMQMYRELTRTCNSARGGPIEQSFLYYDGAGSAGWCDICNQEEYIATFEGFSFHWIAELIKDHLQDTKYNKKQLDLIGIGCGDGKKEGKLIQGLLDLSPNLNINCYLIDKSLPLLVGAHSHLDSIFADSGRVKIREHFADFMKLTNIPDLFDSEESQNTLRIGTMFGGTLGNLDNELRFVRDSLQAFKPGDLLLVDVVLGFASHDNIEAINIEDPRMSFQGIYQASTQNWLTSILKRHRSIWGDLHFQNVLKPSTSPFAKTYTIELQATIESEKQRPTFNMLRLHRYNQEEFIGTFLKEGWKRLSGKTYGLKKRKFLYLFIKE